MELTNSFHLVPMFHSCRVSSELSHSACGSASHSHLSPNVSAPSGRWLEKSPMTWLLLFGGQSSWCFFGIGISSARVWNMNQNKPPPDNCWGRLEKTLAEIKRSSTEGGPGASASGEPVCVSFFGCGLRLQGASHQLPDGESRVWPLAEQLTRMPRTALGMSFLTGPHHPLCGRGKALGLSWGWGVSG